MQFNLKNIDNLLGVTPCEKCKGPACPNDSSGRSFPLYLFTKEHKKDAVPIPNPAGAYIPKNDKSS